MTTATTHTTAARIKRTAWQGTRSQHDYEQKAIRLASRQLGLIHWDDEYSNGWGDGHRFLFGDYSRLIVDGRGVVVGDSDLT